MFKLPFKIWPVFFIVSLTSWRKQAERSHISSLSTWVQASGPGSAAHTSLLEADWEAPVWRSRIHEEVHLSQDGGEGLTCLKDKNGEGSGIWHSAMWEQSAHVVMGLWALPAVGLQLFMPWQSESQILWLSCRFLETDNTDKSFNSSDWIG